jgi:hypothetical protein
MLPYNIHSLVREYFFIFALPAIIINQLNYEVM